MGMERIVFCESTGRPQGLLINVKHYPKIEHERSVSLSL